MIIIKMTHKVAKSLTVHIFLYTLTSDLLLLVLIVFIIVLLIFNLIHKTLNIINCMIVVALTNYSDPASFFVTNTYAQNMLHTKNLEELLYQESSYMYIICSNFLVVVLL
jgi:hypothetical protein